MEKQEQSKSGTMQLVLGMLVITVVGLGAGFGLSKALTKPESLRTAENTSGPNSTGVTAGAETESRAGAKLATAETAAAGQEVKQTAAGVFRFTDIKDVVLTPFPPITSNIAMPESVWIRLEGVMAIKPNSGVKPADLVQLASTQMIAYVRTLKLADIQGATGFQAFNADLNELVRNVTEGQARAVLISGFIVE
jgi:flagellar protein FliL